MKTVFAIFILTTTGLCANPLTIEDKFSWDKVYLELEYTSPQKLSLWIINDNKLTHKLRYKTAFRINGIVLRPKKSKIYRQIILPAQQRILVEELKLRTYTSYIKAYLRVHRKKTLETQRQIDSRKNKVVITEEMCPPNGSAYPQTRAERNSRLDRRIWQRRQNQRQQRTNRNKTK
ncbi:hypothetical protein [Candidatus Uabimicrobium amorphum]|uniref:Uncharacterized protein n=1 Tax=Uabimicrobium amorphum TaxID=2596890 RepID=A0A5S9IPX7_UABAM|nr:hypothetical protein [Candidatus Uabimicrobium amorphum]BBM85521.1 hypothetical protein UABAM_03890 [Candidatus Uabimicrobium amorphum]